MERAKYGEDKPEFQSGAGIADDPNCVESKFKDGTMTVKEFVQRNGEDTGYGRAMAA
jgi:hypothetical protein